MSLPAAIGGAAGYFGYEYVNPPQQWCNIMILTGPPGAGKMAAVEKDARLGLGGFNHLDKQMADVQRGLNTARSPSTGTLQG